MAQQTPGRTTRSRAKTPAAVPAVAVGSSTSYGAPGKAVLRTQVTSGRTSLASILQESRTSKTPLKENGAAGSRLYSAPRDDDSNNEIRGIMPEENATQTRRRLRHSRRTNGNSTVGSSAEEEVKSHANDIDSELYSKEPEDPSEQELSPPNTTDQQNGLDGIGTQTFIDENAAYTHPQQRVYQPRPSPLPQPLVNDSEFEPSSWKVTALTIPKWCFQAMEDWSKGGWEFFKAFSALTVLLLVCVAVASSAALIIFGFWTFLFLPVCNFLARYGAAAPSGQHDVSLTNRTLEELRDAWVRFQLNETYWTELTVDDMDQHGLNSALVARIDQLGKRVKTVEDALGLQNQTLLELEHSLPQALVVRKVGEHWEIPDHFWQALHQRVTSKDSSLWRKFIANNDQQVWNQSKDKLISEIDRRVGELHVISREMFLDELNKNYKMLQRDYKDDLRKAEAQVYDRVRREVLNGNQNAGGQYKTTFLQVEAHARANIVKNLQRALQEHNFFSPGMGARVDPRLTSTSYKPPRHGWLSPEKRSAIAALTRWEEAGDCWCAAPSDDNGKAQIAVTLAEEIYPDYVVVEHIPASGTRQIKSAPRRLEFWVEIEASSRKVEDTILPYIREEMELRQADSCRSAPPTSRHICIGTGQYDIHNENWVQIFSTYAHNVPGGLKIRRMIVRATSNWGADFTCFYRLRLTGRPVVEEQ